MNFSGKYQLQSQENFEPFMKAVGECWAGRQGLGSWQRGSDLQMMVIQGLDVGIGG